ncbi:hypothetical protein [Cupriavidus sp.]|uniref:hypothetical protein n=1 Tax=Cupriavidus sp. TaxID=1873897 RepID=UPI0031E48979
MSNQEQNIPAGDGLTVADYQAAFEDHQRMVRELDVLLNGDAAAKQASLCDIVAQVRKEGIRSHGVALTEQQAKNLHSHMMAVACRTWDQAEPTSVKARLRAVMKALAAEPKIRADLSAAPRQPGEMGAGVQDKVLLPMPLIVDRDGSVIELRFEEESQAEEFASALTLPAPAGKAFPANVEFSASAQQDTWERFAAWLLDHCEGQTITEEFLQEQMAEMLASLKGASDAAI